MKVKAEEIRKIRKMIDDEANLDPEAWRHYAGRLLEAFDDVCGRIEDISNEYI